MLYNVNGQVLYDSFTADMELDYAYDSTTGANYSVVRVYKHRRDGSTQYPFIRYPGRMTTAAFAAQEKWALIANAGLGVSAQQPIDGIAIEDGEVIYNHPASYHLNAVPLTIDSNGDLGTAAADADADTLVANGIVSATCGFCPIIVDYDPVSFPAVDINGGGNHFNADNPRSIIGQFGNGDYAILGCAGRNLDNSTGWTLAEAQSICQKLGLKFAYNLDGGNSTSLYLGQHPVYDYQPGTTRIIPSFIVFNGTNQFEIP